MSTIKYWIGQHDEYPLYYHVDGKLKGTYTGIINEIAARSGCEAELVTQHNGAEITAGEAVELLRSGELDMVLGLAAASDGEYRLLSEADTGRSYTDEDIVLTGPVCVNNLVALVKADSPMAQLRDIGNFYWGIENSSMGFIKGTEFDGHTLDFNSVSECYEALDEQAVYGIFVKQSAVDYAAYVSKGMPYRVFEGVKIPYSESIYLNAKNTELNEIVEQVSAEYAILKPRDEAAYTNLLMKEYAKSGTLTYVAYTAAGIAFLLAVFTAWLFVRLKNRRLQHSAALKTLLDADPDKEMFEIDLKTGKVLAHKDFSIFESRRPGLESGSTLAKLSKEFGYDFEEHYASVGLHGNTIYKNRMIIYVDGRKLLITEEGRRVGHVLYVTLTRM